MTQSRSDAGARRRDLYAEITALILADLEAGAAPWDQPWFTPEATGLPRNAATGRPYSGVNVLLLWRVARQWGFPTLGFLTFRQALALGGHVQRGEHGFKVVFAERVVLAAERRRAAAEGRPPEAIPILKPFIVFNAAQCAGLPDTIAAAPPPIPEGLIQPRAEALIRACGADLRIGGGLAAYDPQADLVRIPHPEAYPEPINWHRTAFHELAHWTGHATRLGRNQTGAFGSAAYAREELVAEIAGAFVCAALGVVPTVRHADYLASWIAVLREDPKAVVRAASAAARAADFLLAFAPPEVAAGAAS